MDDVKIRTATLDDMNVLLEFEQGVIKAERPYDVTLGADPITYYNLEELILRWVLIIHFFQKTNRTNEMQGIFFCNSYGYSIKNITQSGCSLSLFPKGYT